MFVAAIGLRVRAQGMRAGMPLLVAGAAGALTCLLLFAPVFDQVLAYLGKVPEEARARPHGAAGILELLAGEGG